MCALARVRCSLLLVLPCVRVIGRVRAVVLGRCSLFPVVVFVMVRCSLLLPLCLLLVMCMFLS